MNFFDKPLGHQPSRKGAQSAPLTEPNDKATEANNKTSPNLSEPAPAECAHARPVPVRPGYKARFLDSHDPYATDEPLSPPVQHPLQAQSWQPSPTLYARDAFYTSDNSKREHTESLRYWVYGSPQQKRFDATSPQTQHKVLRSPSMTSLGSAGHPTSSYPPSMGTVASDELVEATEATEAMEADKVPTHGPLQTFKRPSA